MPLNLDFFIQIMTSKFCYNIVICADLFVKSMLPNVGRHRQIESLACTTSQLLTKWEAIMNAVSIEEKLQTCTTEF